MKVKFLVDLLMLHNSTESTESNETIKLPEYQCLQYPTGMTMIATEGTVKGTCLPGYTLLYMLYIDTLQNKNFLMNLQYVVSYEWQKQVKFERKCTTCGL